MAHMSQLVSGVLQELNIAKDIYDAMRKNDLAEVVMVFLESLRKASCMPQMHKQVKTEEKSDVFRKLGNDSLKQKQYQATLVFYNQALLFAPPNSRAMKLAYSNRSAMLFTMKQFSAALKDIETVFDMGCPEDIKEKLRKRENDCHERLWQEMVVDGCNSKYAAEYFKFDVEKNSEIPCAIKSVGIRMDTPIPKVLAFKDIEVGQLVAVETAFVSENAENNLYLCCYYCHKMYLNLKPCDKCSRALFCSAHCKCKCIDEYHGIECQMIEVCEEVSPRNSLVGLGLKAVIKMWNTTKDWGRIIKSSEEMGRIGFRKSSRKEMFDAENPFSLLYFDEEQDFNYGRMYNVGLYSAVLIHNLADVPSFLPKSRAEKKLAIKAVARIMLGVCLFVPRIKILESVIRVHSSKMTLHSPVNAGYFAFTSKLKHACNANLSIVGINNKIALIAVKPIKKNTELTVSYVLHWTENTFEPSLRMVGLYEEYGILCGCLVCKDFGGGGAIYSLTDAQRSCFAKLKVSQIDKDINDAAGAEKHEKRLCRALAAFADRPGSNEYEKLITLYRRCVQYGQIAATGNKALT